MEVKIPQASFLDFRKPRQMLTYLKAILNELKESPEIFILCSDIKAKKIITHLTDMGHSNIKMDRVKLKEATTTNGDKIINMPMFIFYTSTPTG